MLDTSDEDVGTTTDRVARAEASGLCAVPRPHRALTGRAPGPGVLTDGSPRRSPATVGR